MRQLVIEDDNGDLEFVNPDSLQSRMARKKSPGMAYAAHTTSDTARYYNVRLKRYLGLVRVQVREWHFRRGNPVPVPRYGDLADKAMLDRTLDGVIGRVEDIADDAPVRAVMNAGRDMMQFILLGAIGVIILLVVALIAVAR